MAYSRATSNGGVGGHGAGHSGISLRQKKMKKDYGGRRRKARCSCSVAAHQTEEEKDGEEHVSYFISEWEGKTLGVFYFSAAPLQRTVWKSRRQQGRA